MRVAATFATPFLIALAACTPPEPQMVAAASVSAADHPTTRGSSAHIQYLGGDGSSLEQAILIHGAVGESDGIQSEYDWVARNRPGWSPSGQALLVQGSRTYDLLYLSRGSEKAEVYFDITEYFGKGFL